jgi:hypothetical protein
MRSRSASSAEERLLQFFLGRNISGDSISITGEHSNLKPAGYSDRKPATLGVNRMGRFDDVVEG